MKTPYSLQAVLSLLCLKKVRPFNMKKNSSQYWFLQKAHHPQPQRILEVGSEDIQVPFKSLYCLIIFEWFKFFLM